MRPTLPNGCLSFENGRRLADRSLGVSGVSMCVKQSLVEIYNGGVMSFYVDTVGDFLFL